MPDEPKKPIEELLEASAKARRAAFGADPKMPNPTRARLHDEIAKVAAEQQTTAEPRGSWVTMFWPRIAVAAAVATLIVIGPMMWWRGSTSRGRALTQLGQNTSSIATGTNAAAVPSEETFAKGAAAGVAPAAPNVSLADNSRAEIAPEETPATTVDELQSKEIAKSDSTAATSAQVTKGLLSKDEVRTESDRLAAAPGAASANRADSATTGIAAARQAEARPMGQQFRQQQQVGQVFRNNAPINRSANVLNTFQVQQDGSEIRMVDSDGSTYTGKIEPIQQPTELLAKRRKTYQSRVGSLADKKAELMQSRFRATGYNVSLKKPLVFEGNYSGPGTQQQNLTNDSKAATARPEQARIVGTVHVNGEKPMLVDAVAEPGPTPTQKNER